MCEDAKKHVRPASSSADMLPITDDRSDMYYDNRCRQNPCVSFLSHKIRFIITKIPHSSRNKFGFRLERVWFTQRAAESRTEQVGAGLCCQARQKAPNHQKCAGESVCACAFRCRGGRLCPPAEHSVFTEIYGEFATFSGRQSRRPLQAAMQNCDCPSGGAELRPYQLRSIFVGFTEQGSRHSA